MQTAALHALLTNVRFTGSAKIHKRELLWMLGRVNDNASAWGLLIGEWEEIGCDPTELHGLEHGENITLIKDRPVAISRWAGS